MEHAVEVPGGRLHVVDDGAGPPIVLVHAGIVDHTAWDALVPALVGAGYRVVRYDTRGWGRSTTEDVPFSNRADLVAILDALGIGRAALVGNSRGGSIVLDTTLEYPGRVAATVLIASTVGGWEGPLTEVEEALLAEMERLEALDPPDPDGVAAFDVALWVDGPGQPPGRAPAALRERVAALDRPLYVAGRIFGRPIVLDPPAFQRLAQLSAPVLVVSGALDVSDTRAAGDLLAERVGAVHLVVPGVAHLVAMERPEEVATHLRDFLDPLRPWA